MIVMGAVGVHVRRAGIKRRTGWAVRVMMFVLVLVLMALPMRMAAAVDVHVRLRPIMGM